MEVRLTINHNVHNVLIDSDEMLLDTLRRLGYKSVKKGCETTTCGICSVSIDDQLVPSCSYLSYRAVGKEVLTVEGIADDARKIAECLTAEGVEQCGHCSPSLVMAIHTMFKENSNPTEDEIRHYLAGNMCRCSGFEGQHRAIRKYMEVR
jgi:carbon-monoxide dehydrogenase small subunit